ncbi:NACHT domain-containing protein [Spirillospora sp. CA-253888]
MPDLILGLGAAVVKTACKLVLGDNQILAELSGSVVDAVAGQDAGVRERRRARRLLENLEETVADKILTTMGHEFAGLPEHERNAAVLAVTASLDRAELTDEDLFAADLDALYLERHVRRSHPGATRDLDHRAAALYDHVLAECCAYVIEVTIGLPAFEKGALTQVLRRETEILEGVRELLDRLPGPDAGTPDAAFLAAYRRQVTAKLDQMELFGVTASESVRRYPLSVAYISLQVQADGLGVRPVHLGERDREAAGTMRVEQALAASRALFLRGEAGSGKTTLLRWLAVRSARRDFPEALAAWNDTVPFLIPLRRYVGRSLPAPENFLDQVGRHIADEMPKGWVHGLLRSGRALLLIDGIDELPKAERGPAREWLRELTRTYPEAHYIVTSRPGAAGARWLDREGFEAADLRPMTWPDVQAFIRHWHAALRSGPTSPEQVDGCESGLLEKIRSRGHLRALSTNPLLCALICALHLDRRMQLPRDRMELYDVALEMLLERRDVERRIGGEHPPLARTDKILLLQDQAYWLIRNGWSDAPVERVVERVRERLAGMPRLAGQQAEDVFHYLLVRSGLIRQPVEGRVDFVHRTFQEYLAARAAVAADDIGVLVGHAGDDQWSEVIVMAAGHAHPRQRTELITGILDRADLGTPAGRAVAARAVACLETSPELDAALHDRVQSVARLLLPPSRMSDAEALARAGDFLLDLMADRSVRGPRQAAATIRAAARVGGAGALSLIARCASSKGRDVRNELMAAWPQFNTADFAREVLRGSPHEEQLSLRDAGVVLSSVRHLHGVKHLDYQRESGPGDIEFVRHLSELKTLYIYKDPDLSDLSPLRDHPTLTTLWLRRTAVHDITVLASLPKLNGLSIEDVEFDDLSVLKRCPGLTRLWLDRPSLTQLDGILPDHRMTLLGLRRTDIEDALARLADIERLSDLTSLDFFNCTGRSLNGLETWASTLTSLVLWPCSELRDLTGVASLRRLQKLEIAGPPYDLAPIVDLPELHFLNLSDAPGFDLYPVGNLAALDYLSLQGRGTVDLSPLAGRENLRVRSTRGIRLIGADRLGPGSKITRPR